MTQELNIHFEGSGIIPAFDTPVALVTGANSVAFFDYIQANEYKIGDKTVTRAEAEAIIDTPDNAYIAGICGENEAEGQSETCFIWLNEMRLTNSVVAEESQHCAQCICCDNQLAADGEICVELTHEVTEAVTLALTDAGFTVRNDIATEDITESPEENMTMDRIGMQVMNKFDPKAALSKTVLNWWEDDCYNNSLPAFQMDADGVMHGFIFGDIGGWWGGVSVGDFIRTARMSSGTKAIKLYINSPGGDVNDANAINGILAGSGLPVEVYYFGTCASSATFIGLVPNAKVYAEKGALLMIHRASGYIGWANATEMENGANTMQKHDSTIFGRYADKCGKPADAIMQDVANAGGELWMTAEEALAYGLIDGIESGMFPQFKVAASLPDKYKNLTRPMAHTNSLTTNPNSAMKAEDQDVALVDKLVNAIRSVFPAAKATDPKGEGEEKAPDPLAALSARMDQLAADLKAKDEKIAALEAEKITAAKAADEATKEENEIKASREALKKMPPVATPSAMATKQEPVDKTADPATSFVNKVKAMTAELGVGVQ